MLYIYIVVLIGVIIYGGVCGFLYLNQRRLLYFPTPAVELADTRHFFIHPEGQSLKTWLLNEGKQRAIIYFGGNAEAVETNIPAFKHMFPEHSVYILNYRGYGGSSGVPNEKSLFSDALFLYDEVKKKQQTISLIGRSLGTGVAMYLAANRKIERLALVTPYDSIVNVARQKYPFFPVALLLQDKFESILYAPQIKSMTLVIIAEYDKMIPRVNSDALLEGFSPGIASKIVIKDHDHNSLSADAQYEKELRTFLE